MNESIIIKPNRGATLRCAVRISGTNTLLDATQNLCMYNDKFICLRDKEIEIVKRLELIELNL